MQNECTKKKEKKKKKRNILLPPISQHTGVSLLADRMALESSDGWMGGLGKILFDREALLSASRKP